MIQPSNYKGHCGRPKHQSEPLTDEQRREIKDKHEEAEARRWMEGLVMSIGVHRESGKYRVKFYGLPGCTGPEITMDESTFKQLAIAVTQMAGNPDLKEFVTD